MAKARIISMGSYLPERVLTNQNLENMVETTDEWIVSRTGIKERRIAHADETTSDMGTAAARQALKGAHLAAADIDLVIVATMTPDYISPSTAAIIQHKLGAVRAAAFDIQAACSGYVYALSTAKAFVESGMYRNVMVVASEKMSAVVDYTDRNTCVIFGDGASASVVSSQGEGLSIDAICLGADGGLAELVMIPGGGTRHPASYETIDKKMHYFQMAGKEVFKHAVRRKSAVAKQCLDLAGLTDQDVSWIVPHQANIRIMEAISKSFSLPEEKIYKTIHKYGNTSAASIAIALDELTQEKPLKRGENVLLVAFGGGLTWGAALLTQTA